MPIKVILNPNADVGNGIKHLETIKIAMEPLDGVDFVLTEGVGHAAALAKEAIEAGCDLIVAAGGDGTVNEVANGMMMAGAEGVRLGIIPLGTGNDFAHALGIVGDAASGRRHHHRRPHAQSRHRLAGR